MTIKKKTNCKKENNNVECAVEGGTLPLYSHKTIIQLTTEELNKNPVKPKVRVHKHDLPVYIAFAQI